MKGFEVSGIYPYNRDIFSEDDFLCSYVTDRPEPSKNIPGNEHTQSISEQETLTTLSLQQLDSQTTIQNDPASELNISIENDYQLQLGKPVLLTPAKITPETVRPFIKANPRKAACCTSKKTWKNKNFNRYARKVCYIK